MVSKYQFVYLVLSHWVIPGETPLTVAIVLRVNRDAP